MDIHATAQVPLPASVLPDPRQGLRLRFERKVERIPGGCWEWRAYRSRLGYGELRAEGRTQRAHRVAYRLYRGEIPVGMEIDHLCRNRGCVNPDHLDIVTHAENQRRSDSVSGVNARKVVCLRSHPLSGGNLVIDANGKRQCRICMRLRARASSAPTAPA